MMVLNDLFRILAGNYVQITLSKIMQTLLLWSIKDLECKGFVPKKLKLKHRMTLPYFFNQTIKENVTSYSFWDDTRLVIFSTNNDGLPSSEGFNWPLRGTKYTVSGGRARRGCICMQAVCIWKMMKISETKRREKQRIFACDGLVSNVNQSSRRGLSPYWRF